MIRLLSLFSGIGAFEKALQNLIFHNANNIKLISYAV